MSLRKSSNLRRYAAGALCVATLAVSSTALAEFSRSDLTVIDTVEPPPEPTPDPIYIQSVFSGYICEMDVGRKTTDTIYLDMKTEPHCGGSTAGFVALCFVKNGIGLTCPHEDNPSATPQLYDVEVKGALIQSLQQSMLSGQLLEVQRLSNTFDYPHYEGPQEYGNRVLFKAHQFQ